MWLAVLCGTKVKQLTFTFQTRCSFVTSYCHYTVYTSHSYIVVRLARVGHASIAIYSRVQSDQSVYIRRCISTPEGKRLYDIVSSFISANNFIIVVFKEKGIDILQLACSSIICTRTALWLQKAVHANCDTYL